MVQKSAKRGDSKVPQDTQRDRDGAHIAKRIGHKSIAKR